MKQDTAQVTQEHLENLKRSCLGATISQFLHRTIEIPEAGRAKVTIPFNPQLTQNSDFVHGAVLFEAADTAGFIAANSLEPTYTLLTVDYYIRLLRPVQREGIHAVAEVVHQGRTLLTTRSEVFSDSGTLVAAGQGTYMVTRIPLTQVAGYNNDSAEPSG